jgi:hypothetical protein
LNKRILILSCLLTLAVQGQESMQFLYPVAQIDEDNLLLLHQKSFDEVELWRWNKNEKIAFKELNSVFLPSLVTLLPSKLACSFVDRGRIKIKYFAKRTPRSIDMCEPISAISSMNWIDDENFYFVGKHEGHFGIFLCDITDHNCIISCLSNLGQSLDYLYPQKINDYLFCITKNQSGQYAICKLDWDPKLYKHELHATMQTRHAKFKNHELSNGSSEAKDALLSSVRPLCFLHMQDESIGFVLEFAQENQTENLFSFSCFKLEEGLNRDWNLKKLFDFQLPKNLFIGSEFEKIYESIYPFLPVYTQNFIYFVHFDAALQICQIMRYDQKLDQAQKIPQNFLRSSNLHAHFFAPFVVNDSIYAGTSSPCAAVLVGSRSRQNPGLMQADPTTGIFQCQLPEIRL